MKLLVTGGAGFIGSALIRMLIAETRHQVLNLDKLTYAGNLDSLDCVNQSPNYQFREVDICDSQKVGAAFQDFEPDAILHLAAESHVDRSIDGPMEFITTNVLGTCTLLEAARSYVSCLGEARKSKFRFHHISTDEVYGDLEEGKLFTETTPYAPSSPYSASKASSDHLVRSWQRTFELPTLITNCSNNYGSHQFPEKLIPLIILNAIEGKPLPIYGDGQQVRDWLHVDDHARALITVLENGTPGETYNIGGHNEMTNLQVVETICSILDERISKVPGGHKKFSDLITFVKDRPGHDVRYAIDATKIESDLGWTPRETFKTGIQKTVDWYLENETWCKRVQDGSYMRDRLGLGA